MPQILFTSNTNFYMANLQISIYEIPVQLFQNNSNNVRLNYMDLSSTHLLLIKNILPKCFSFIKPVLLTVAEQRSILYFENKFYLIYVLVETIACAYSSY